MSIPFAPSSPETSSSSVKRKLPHFPQNSSPAPCSILHCGQMAIFTSWTFPLLNHHIKPSMHLMCHKANEILPSNFRLFFPFKVHIEQNFIVRIKIVHPKGNTRFSFGRKMIALRQRLPASSALDLPQLYRGGYAPSHNPRLVPNPCAFRQIKKALYLVCQLQQSLQVTSSIPKSLSVMFTPNHK